ncbi:MAG TPA: IS21 family transposase [Xanthomonadaceae bacterium]|jgi:transposase
MRVPVHEQRDILSRIFDHPTESNRSIAKAIGVAANTVGSLRAALDQCGIPYSVLAVMDDRQWVQALGNEDRSIAKRKLAPDWHTVHEDMCKPNATITQLWYEFREAHPEGIGLTQFSAGYAVYTKTLNIVLRRAHVPGEKSYCDFCGQTMTIHDPDGGPGFEAPIFVSVLGYSNYTFIRAVASQEVGNWNICHVQAFEFYGGSTEWTVSDNLKAAIIRRTTETLFVNKAYRECLKHYSCNALPRGVRKPRQNAKAEAGVQVVQRWVLFALRGQKYFSLDELNQDLNRLRDILNSREFKKSKNESRRSRFDAVEKVALRPLPSQPFEPREWRFSVLVGPDYLFEHERRFYSVPYELRGVRVDLRITEKMVEAMHRGKRVALHQKATAEGEIKMLREHMPVAHTRVLDGEPRALMSWASTVGPNSEAMFAFHLKERADLTNGLRTARRLRELARVHEDARFEEVCAYALRLNMTSFRNVESILKTSTDKRPRSDTTSEAKQAPHENVRGADYFGDEK